MKKAIALLSVMVLCVTLFAGCGGGKTATETYEYTNRKVKVSVSYPESKFTKSENPSVDGKSSYKDIVLMSDKIQIEVGFTKYGQSDKSFAGLKEYWKNSIILKDTFKEFTVNGREAFSLKWSKYIYIPINIEDISDTTEPMNMLHLQVAIAPVNDDVNVSDYIDTDEVQKIINSIKASKI